MREPADGLLSALTESGVLTGDEVIVPSYTSVEVAAAVQQAGALPVFADIDPETYCLDPRAVAGAVTARTVAVVSVPQFGYRADRTPLRQVAERHGLLLLETSTAQDLSAGTAARRANAAFLDAHLTGLRTPRVREGDSHDFEEFVVRVPGNGRPDRDAFARTLQARGVRCRIPVTTPVHRMPGYRTGAWLPETEQAAAECLALSVATDMTVRRLKRVASACNSLGGLITLAAS